MDRRTLFLVLLLLVPGSCLYARSGARDPVPKKEPTKGTSDLSGTWLGDDGGTYYLTQDGEQLWWVGMSADGGRTYTNAFWGSFNEVKMIEGAWSDVPRGAASNRGTLLLNLSRGKNGEEVELWIRKQKGDSFPAGVLKRQAVSAGKPDPNDTPRPEPGERGRPKPQGPSGKPDPRNTRPQPGPGEPSPGKPLLPFFEPAPESFDRAYVSPADLGYPNAKPAPPPPYYHIMHRATSRFVTSPVGLEKPRPDRPSPAQLSWPIPRGQSARYLFNLRRQGDFYLFEHKYSRQYLMSNDRLSAFVSGTPDVHRRDPKSGPLSDYLFALIPTKSGSVFIRQSPDEKSGLQGKFLLGGWRDGDPLGLHDFGQKDGVTEFEILEPETVPWPPPDPRTKPDEMPPQSKGHAYLAHAESGQFATTKTADAGEPIRLAFPIPAGGNEDYLFEVIFLYGKDGRPVVFLKHKTSSRHLCMTDVSEVWPQLGEKTIPEGQTDNYSFLLLPSPAGNGTWLLKNVWSKKLLCPFGGSLGSKTYTEKQAAEFEFHVLYRWVP